MILFADYESGISQREDSRAFGAMIEKRMTTNWENICDKLGYQALSNPGKRTIYDFACKIDEIVVGFDVKTKDLDSKKYSDGGVCAVGNLLKFLANDKGVFIIVGFGHSTISSQADIRDIEYIHAAPFHLLPNNTYRIENLGTGQVRLNYSIQKIFEEIEWDRQVQNFYDTFTDLAILHYQRVGRDAQKD